MSHRFRPRFAVQQNVCDRERPGFPNSRERHIARDGDRLARVVHILAVLPADEGIAGSRFFAKRHILAVSRRLRPRFAVQQDVCDRERPGIPNSRECLVLRDGDRLARAVHILAVLPADEGIAGSRFLAKRHILAVSRLFRPRFAVQQDICDRERPIFPNSRERHSARDGDVDFSVFSGRIDFLILVLPACKQIPFLCGRFEGDGRALMRILAAASAYAAVRVDFDVHRACFIRSDERLFAL